MKKLLFAICFISCNALANPDASIEAFDRGDYIQAKKLFRAQLQKTPDNLDALLYLGRSLMALQDAESAAEQFAAAIKLAPNHADAHYWYGAANGTLAGNASIFSAGGYAKKAKQAFLAAIKHDPAHIPAHRGLITFYTQAPKIFGGDDDKAKEVIARLKNLDAVAGALSEANFLREEDQDEQAEALLVALAQKYPSDPRAFMQLGFIAQNDKDYVQAFALFLQGSKGEASSDDTRRAKLACLYQVGRTAYFAKTNLAEGKQAFETYLAQPQLADLPDKSLLFLVFSQLL